MTLKNQVLIKNNRINYKYYSFQKILKNLWNTIKKNIENLKSKLEKTSNEEYKEILRNEIVDLEQSLKESEEKLSKWESKYKGIKSEETNINEKIKLAGLGLTKPTSN